jgi:hypothetical protein
MIILTQEIIQKVTDNNAWVVLTKSIAMRASNEQTCFPSISKICEDTGLCKNSVLKALKYLVENKIISKHKKLNKNGGFGSNFYTICTEEIKVVRGVKMDKEDDTSGSKNEPTLVHQMNKGSAPDELPLVHQKDTNSQVQINSQDHLTLDRENFKKNENQLPNNRVDQFISNPDFEQNHKTRFPNYSIDEIRLLLMTYFGDYPKSKNTIVYNFLSETYRKEGKKWDKKPESNEPTVQDIHDKYNITF